ncbi:DUF551 domain-containing protein [Porticoccaceae bacterium]|nr:DUF551 domain-containing protein [Porticoccaceae bacterium]MDA8651656.1 DUF551 domain-containing protein [Porticoccaceae bacterium]MDA8682944.1 DUF551 domain-containing protein [Porticoccaceae bacterium]MDB2664462.1 DUF551 domain-containing protein [Porticoccaceae bacterium]
MKWISVKDRLPTNSEPVFIWPQIDSITTNFIHTDEVKDRFTGEYHSSKFKRENTEHESGWYVETTDGYRSYMNFVKVTHWMPLFKPPTTRRG